MVGCFLLVLIGVLFITLHTITSADNLSGHVFTQAEVVSSREDRRLVRRLRNTHHETKYYMTVRYYVGNSEYVEEREVPRYVYLDWRDCKEMPITYNVKRPVLWELTKSKVVPGKVNDTLIGVCGIMCGAAGVVVRLAFHINMSTISMLLFFVLLTLVLGLSFLGVFGIEESYTGETVAMVTGVEVAEGTVLLYYPVIEYTMAGVRYESRFTVPVREKDEYKVGDMVTVVCKKDNHEEWFICSGKGTGLSLLVVSALSLLLLICVVIKYVGGL